MNISILYILHGTGGGGGAHSIVQECLEIHRFGIKAQIAVKKSKYGQFLENYREIITEIHEILLPYTNVAELKKLTSNFSIICATIYTSAKTLQELIAEKSQAFLPAYYIQDYEPLFSAKNSPEWEEARRSYTLIPNMVLFAKTKWLCDIVGFNHNVTVNKVEPSIDHQVYYPSLGKNFNHIEIAIMVRFSTNRRAPKRTLRVANTLSEMFPEKIRFTIFGSNREEIESQGMVMPENATALGHLRRPEVAAVLRNSDIFLDLSDYQAFGRTAVEAMACGCIPVVPELGGASEFAVDGINSLMVNTGSETDCINKIVTLIKANSDVLLQMKLEGIQTASRYSKRRAACSIINLFYSKFMDFQKDNPINS